MPEPFEAGVGAIGSLASNRGLYVVVVMIGGEKKACTYVWCRVEQRRDDGGEGCDDD